MTPCTHEREWEVNTPFVDGVTIVTGEPFTGIQLRAGAIGKLLVFTKRLLPCKTCEIDKVEKDLEKLVHARETLNKAFPNI